MWNRNGSGRANGNGCGCGCRCRCESIYALLYPSLLVFIFARFEYIVHTDDFAHN